MDMIPVRPLQTLQDSKPAESNLSEEMAKTPNLPFESCIDTSHSFRQQPTCACTLAITAKTGSASQLANNNPTRKQRNRMPDQISNRGIRTTLSLSCKTALPVVAFSGHHARLLHINRVAGW